MPPLRYAIRQLLHTPGFTVVALLILGLGIGVNAAMFSLLDALLFRDAPFPRADRVTLLVSRTPQGPRLEHSATEQREIREAQPAFAALTTYSVNRYVLAEADRPAERVMTINASAELWDTLGVQPMLGRAFTPEEATRGRNQVVVLSHRLWQQRYGGAADVLGRTLRLDGESVTIIGVMPPGFDYPRLWQGAELWRPLDFDDEQLAWRDYRVFRLLGRLGPSAALPQVEASLAAVAHQQATAFPDLYTGLRYEVVALNEALTNQLTRRISWLLLGLAGFVLLIACANLANLQLARACLRSRDLAIRSALGASRLRLITQQVVESVVIARGGGVLGLGLAGALNQVLERQLTLGGAPGALDLQLNATVVAVTFLVALATGIVFGLVPAWLRSRVDPNVVLKSQGRGTTSGRDSHRWREALVVAEISLALVLLSGAAIMQRGFAQFLQNESGWDDDRVLTAALPIPATRYPNSSDRVELFRTIERELQALPGVESAALASSLPVYGYNSDRQVLLEGQSPGESANLPRAFHVMVSESYFATMGIRLLAGDRFAPEIKSQDPPVIIVNEALAQQLWPGQSAIGQRLCSMDSGLPFWAEVIGVVSNVEAAAALGEPSTRFTVYKPIAQEAWGWTYLVLRSPVPASLTETLRRTMLQLDPDLPPDNISTVAQLVDYSQHNLRLAGQTLTAFGALGLLLAAVGVYGVLANLVAQRTGEFGIRIALGASSADILGMVLRQGLRLTAIGIGLGLVGAYGLGQFLHRSMPRLASIDWVALLAMALVLAAVGIGACLWPARRATRVDPLIALRDD